MKDRTIFLHGELGQRTGRAVVLRIISFEQCFLRGSDLVFWLGIERDGIATAPAYFHELSFDGVALKASQQPVVPRWQGHHLTGLIHNRDERFILPTAETIHGRTIFHYIMRLPDLDYRILAG